LSSRLRKLSTAAFLVHDELCRVTKADPIASTFEIDKKIVKAVTQAWSQVASKSIKPAVVQLIQSKPTAKSIALFSEKLGVKLAKPLTSKQIDAIQIQIQKIFAISKKAASKQAKISFNFAQADADAVALINRQQVFWIGDFYDAHLSARIQAVAKDILIEQGLDRKDAGRVLEDAVSKEFGLAGETRSEFAPTVPARYAGNPSLYFDAVVSTSAHQSRTFGKVSAFNDAGIQTIQLINPLDRRTGVICQQLAGQVFTTEIAVDHMNGVLGAKDPKDIKNIAPWLSGSQIESILSGTQVGSPAASVKLSKAGVMLPPFHAFCRTEPVVVSVDFDTSKLPTSVSSSGKNKEIIPFKK